MDIESVRDEIRAKDLEIVSLIKERIGCAERIALIKTENGLPVRNPDVERKVIERYVSEGKRLGIGEDTMTAIAKALIEECVRAEEIIVKDADKK